MRPYPVRAMRFLTGRIDEGPKSGCSFQFFAQLQQSNVPQAALEELEHEIDEPTGITTVRSPDMKFRGVLVSKNCAMVYELPEIEGMKSVSLTLCSEWVCMAGAELSVGRRRCSGRSRHMLVSLLL